MRRFVIFAALALGLAGQALADRVVPFGQGRAEVTLPDAYVTTELNDGTLRALFGPKGENRLELTVREAVSPNGAPNVGEEYVRAQAKAKNFKFFESPGKVVLMQPAADQPDGDKLYRTLQWTVGFGNNVVVMILRAPAEASPETVAFLRTSLNEIIGSLRRKA